MSTTDALKTQGPAGQAPTSENTHILSDSSGGTLGSQEGKIPILLGVLDKDKDDGGKGK